MIRRAYDLNGFTLAVAAEEAHAAAFLDDVLAPLRCEFSGRHDWKVLVSPVENVKAPSEGDCIFEGPLPEGLPSMMVEVDDRRILAAPGHFTVSFRRQERMTEIGYVAGKERALSGTAAFWILDDLLAANDRRLLHGGLLVDPASDKAIAVFAPSGTGKTTSVLALARAGLQLGGDDALVLDVDEDGCWMWAMPRRAKIHRRTAALLPWVGPTLTNAWRQDEQALALETLATLIALAPPRRRRVALVVVLMPPNDETHRLASLAKPEALSMLASDNLRLAPRGVDADAVATLASLAKLVASTPVVALSVGPDPTTLSRDLLGLA